MAWKQPEALRLVCDLVSVKISKTERNGVSQTETTEIKLPLIPLSRRTVRKICGLSCGWQEMLRSWRDWQR